MDVIQLKGSFCQIREWGYACDFVWMIIEKRPKIFVLCKHREAKLKHTHHQYIERLFRLRVLRDCVPQDNESKGFIYYAWNMPDSITIPVISQHLYQFSINWKIFGHHWHRTLCIDMYACVYAMAESIVKVIFRIIVNCLDCGLVNYFIINSVHMENSSK